MKKFLIIFCSLSLISSATLFAYNSDKGAVKQRDGISELPQPVNDSLFQRGKYLVDKTNYGKEDLEAVAVYLNNR
jgi:hypothetical protein